jgi:hypothetical protein
VNDPAFILRCDHSRVGDEGVTAELVPFPGSDDVIGWKVTRPIAVPTPVYFEARVETIREVDFPDNDVNWPIMSERMREMLLHDVPSHRVIPVTFLDDTVPTNERFENGAPRPGVAVQGFAAVQLLERLDAFDMERSEYTADPDLPGRVETLVRLVLKDIPLPSLFRLSAYPSLLLISHQARVELEAAGIQGAVFHPLERAPRL